MCHDQVTRPHRIGGDPAPVELAVMADAADDFPPETFLWFDFYRPDGSVRVRLAWTSGGDVLGDRIDRQAPGAGLNGCDWFHLLTEHAARTTRGRVRITAHPLREVEESIRDGVRCPAPQAEDYARAVAAGEPEVYETVCAAGTWPGVGPGFWLPALAALRR